MILSSEKMRFMDTSAFLCVPKLSFKYLSDGKTNNDVQIDKEFEYGQWHCEVILKSFYYIADAIFRNLTAKDLASCRLVCQSWRDYIDQSSYWSAIQYQQNIAKLNHIRIMPIKWCSYLTGEENESIKAPLLLWFSYWQETFDHFEQNRDLYWKHTKYFVSLMLNYVQSDEPRNRCPLYSSILEPNILEFLLKETNFEFSKFGGFSTRLYGELPFLHYISQYNIDDCIKVIFENFERYGIDINAKADTGLTAFDYATRFDQKASTIRLFLDNVSKLKIDINSLSPHGFTPLMNASSWDFYFETETEETEHDEDDENCKCNADQHFVDIEEVIENDSDIQNNMEHFLKDAYEDLDESFIEDFQDHSSIMKKRDVIEMFLTHPEAKLHTNYNATNDFGQTAFHIICWYGMVPIAKLFLKYKDELGINCSIQDNEGLTPRQYAEKSGWKFDTKILKLLDFHEIN